MNMEAKIVPADEEASPPRRLLERLSRGQRGALVLLPLAVAGAAVGLVSREPAATAAPPPPVVTVAAPIVRQVNEWDEQIGRFVVRQVPDGRKAAGIRQGERGHGQAGLAGDTQRLAAGGEDAQVRARTQEGLR